MPVTVVGVDPALVRRFGQGFQALAFLPSTVRRGVIARTGQASVFTGQAVRHGDGDQHEVTLLGVHPGGAVVVSATTHRDTTNWHVEQYVYTWAQTQPALDGAARRQLREV